MANDNIFDSGNKNNEVSKIINEEIFQNCLSLKEIKKKLQKELDSKRYEHSLGVADTAFWLAYRYNVNPTKAYLAGILHDCAKCIEDDKKLNICKKHKIKLTETEKNNPFLIHSKLGAFIAKKEYQVDDEEILSSISYHTTGKENMTMLEKIIFSADYIEPNRKQIPGLDEIRNIIFNDIDKAIILIYKNTFKYLNEKKQIIDECSLKAFNYYINQ